MNLDFDTARKMFRRSGSNLDRDLANDAFNHPEAIRVPWLIHEPKDNEELAENIFERLRSAGIEFSLNIDDVDTEAIFLSDQISKHGDTL